jgi:hypothetical protein
VFSHKKHAPLKQACTSCHIGAESKDRAGFPDVAKCQVCHKDIAAKIPSTRVYRLPDFAIFSHSKHLASKASCSTCHGEMAQQDSVTLFRSTKMFACVACHKERGATQVCTACHELGQ